MKSLLKKGIDIIAAIVFVSVFCGVLNGSVQKNILILPGVLVLTAGYWLMYKKGAGKRAFRICFFLMVIVQLLLGYYLMVEYSTWDVYAVTKNARALVNGEWFNAAYFARYPNNLTIMVLFTLVFKVTNFLFGSTSNYFLVLLNILAIDVAVLTAVKIMKRLYSEGAAYRAGLVMTMFAPLYLYVPICYTDTFSFPLGVGCVYWIICLAQQWQATPKLKKAVFCAGIGAALLIGYKLKGSLIIILIAAILYLFFKFRWKTFAKAAACIMAGFLAASMVWSAGMNALNLVTEEDYEMYEFPVTHWIMMGLSGTGNFNSDDVNYTMSFENYESKQTATVEKIKERVDDLGITGLIGQFYKKATKYGWNYGTCFAERYLGDTGDQPIHPNFLHELVLTQGKYHDILYVVTQSIWVLLFAAAAAGFVIAVKNKNLEFFMLRLTLVGCMMFFMIWETHPRYILNYTIVLILVAVGQMERGLDAVSARKEIRK